MNPLFHYHLRSAAILSLPLGIAMSFLMQWIPQWLSANPVETAFFIVQNPMEIVAGGSSPAVHEQMLWQDPSFFLGLFTLILIGGSAFMGIRFINSYRELKTLYNNLEFSKDIIVPEASSSENFNLAFHDHPLVPFTFGWKNPVIVLPKVLKSDSEKLKMALQHELIHIQRGDYLLQLALSIIESIFWFHPLIHFGNQEIDTYREISCDQEVLSKTNVSIKSYANLLYELVPLNSGVGRLSVSMAVKQSTLKQRIKTMKYHKLHRTSFKQSIFFLLLMIVGITLPIACSDLRGPQGLTEQELINTEVSFDNSTLEVNGEEIIRYSVSYKTTLNNGMVFSAKQYGLFMVSGTEFEGATKTAKLSENKLTFTTNQLNFTVTKEGQFIEGETTLWVRHFPDKVPASFTASSIPYSALADGDFLNKLIPDRENTSSFDEDLGDYFVVVEKMPEPIGGISALQSKVVYPEMARRAGIEGRVTVQFIVNENGDVENAQVMRGIGGGADEEALRVVEETKFEPGIQKGKPVRVRFAMSINFRLQDSDFSSQE